MTSTSRFCQLSLDDFVVTSEQPTGFMGAFDRIKHLSDEISYKLGKSQGICAFDQIQTFLNDESRHYPGRQLMLKFGGMENLIRRDIRISLETASWSSSSKTTSSSTSSSSTSTTPYAYVALMGVVSFFFGARKTKHTYVAAFDLLVKGT